MDRKENTLAKTSSLEDRTSYLPPLHIILIAENPMEFQEYINNITFLREVIEKDRKIIVYLDFFFQKEIYKKYFTNESYMKNPPKDKKEEEEIFKKIANKKDEYLLDLLSLFLNEEEILKMKTKERSYTHLQNYLAITKKDEEGGIFLEDVHDKFSDHPKFHTYLKATNITLDVGISRNLLFYYLSSIGKTHVISPRFLPPLSNEFYNRLEILLEKNLPPNKPKNDLFKNKKDIKKILKILKEDSIKPFLAKKFPLEIQGNMLYILKESIGIILIESKLKKTDYKIDRSIDRKRVYKIIPNELKEAIIDSLLSFKDNKKALFNSFSSIKTPFIFDQNGEVLSIKNNYHIAFFLHQIISHIETTSDKMIKDFKYSYLKELKKELSYNKGNGAFLFYYSKFIKSFSYEFKDYYFHILDGPADSITRSLLSGKIALDKILFLEKCKKKKLKDRIIKIFIRKNHTKKITQTQIIPSYLYDNLKSHLIKTRGTRQTPEVIISLLKKKNQPLILRIIKDPHSIIYEKSKNKPLFLGTGNPFIEKEKDLKLPYFRDKSSIIQKGSKIKILGHSSYQNTTIEDYTPYKLAKTLSMLLKDITKEKVFNDCTLFSCLLEYKDKTLKHQKGKLHPNSSFSALFAHNLNILGIRINNITAFLNKIQIADHFDRKEIVANSLYPSSSKIIIQSPSLKKNFYPYHIKLLSSKIKSFEEEKSPRHTYKLRNRKNTASSKKKMISIS